MAYLAKGQKSVILPTYSTHTIATTKGHDTTTVNNATQYRLTKILNIKVCTYAAPLVTVISISLNTKRLKYRNVHSDVYYNFRKGKE
jgi:hypothetical protein